MAVYRKYNNQWQNKATENVNITYAFRLVSVVNDATQNWRAPLLKIEADWLALRQRDDIDTFARCGFVPQGQSRRD